VVVVLTAEGAVAVVLTVDIDKLKRKRYKKLGEKREGEKPKRS